jgi:RimJ/RimL family protein N-acetyltransferase
MNLVQTDRLLLRPWRDDDLPPFALMCADARVMQHFPALLSHAESDAAAGRIREHWTEHGFGLWAIELPGVAPFIGFVGLMSPSFEAHFTPCVEVGWRLAPEHWGRGYATEGARAALSFGWETLRLEEIVSMTVLANARSWRVMERLGMKRDPADDFDHPRVPEGHAMRRHILYRLRRPA